MYNIIIHLNNLDALYFESVMVKKTRSTYKSESINFASLELYVVYKD